MFFNLGIKMSYNSGAIRRGYAFIQNIVEVHVFEEWLSFDLLGIFLSRTKTTSRVSG